VGSPLIANVDLMELIGITRGVRTSCEPNAVAHHPAHPPDRG
jgi:hypothetical protein